MTIDEKKVIWEEYATTILRNYASRLRNISSEPEIMEISREMDDFKFDFKRKKEKLPKSTMRRIHEEMNDE